MIHDLLLKLFVILPSSVAYITLYICSMSTPDSRFALLVLAHRIWTADQNLQHRYDKETQKYLSELISTLPITIASEMGHFDYTVAERHDLIARNTELASTMCKMQEIHKKQYLRVLSIAVFLQFQLLLLHSE